jgi:type IV pilus assembly protein PilX
MLSAYKNLPVPQPLRSKQKGVVLVIALVVLVAMLLAGIALVRSVDTANVIAGNLAFQQAATHSGDTGIEAGIAWLESHKTSLTVNCQAPTGSTPCAYNAAGLSNFPVNGTSWNDYWIDDLDGQAVQVNFASDGSPTSAVGGTTTSDASGNSVRYVIHRMCSTVGAPAIGTCSFRPPTPDPNSSLDVNSTPWAAARQVNYRITVKVTGPRNTVSYVQSLVAM